VRSALTGAFSHDRSRVAFRLFHPTGNIITADMIEALRAALDGASREPHLKLITIEGEGTDFSFGASVHEHVPGEIDRVLPLMHRLVEDLLEAPAPTAAVVRGRCLGGGFELALACDFIFAAEDAVFGLPEIALGVFPPAGAALLPVRVGGARATRTILTGASSRASEWNAAGLLEFMASAATLETEVERWVARHIAPRSAAALRHAAAAARTGLLAHVRATLPELERLYLRDLMRTHDAVEGITAFIQKRPPAWTDG
jgi:cyclohexa-1,5-dienecarbonyl-CoA hydratase